MLTQEEEKQLEHLQAKSKDTRITACLAYIGTDISRAIRRITQKYRTGLMRGIYSDPKKCCPEWYDEC